MKDKTISEISFEQFCDQAKIPWERIESSNIEKRPDYKITMDSTNIFIEVKELGDNDDEKKYRKNLKETGFASGNTLGIKTEGERRIRKKINSAMPQLKKAGNSGFPTIVVLHDEKSLFQIGPLEVRLAMFGQDVIDSEFKHHFGRGQKVGKAHNRSLSAVGLLTDKSGILQLQVFGNHFSKTPLPTIPRQFHISQFRLGSIGLGGLPEWEEYHHTDKQT